MMHFTFMSPESSILVVSSVSILLVEKRARSERLDMRAVRFVLVARC